MTEFWRKPPDHSAGETGINRNRLREVERTIVSAYILSKDDFMLLGRHDPSKGGAYPTALRIPGGGVKLGETLLEAMLREGRQEVIGLLLAPDMLRELPITAKGATEKTLDSGEVVWQKMDLRHFEVRLDKPAVELTFLPGDDLVALGWFNREERATVELIPGGRELMLEGGYIDLPATGQ